MIDKNVRSGLSYENKHSYMKILGGIKMVSWIKRNVKNVVMVALMLAGAGYIMNDLLEQKEYIEVQIVEGDTLWSLGKEHKGDMKLNRWIHEVTSNNDIIDNKIIAGDVLLIPAEQNDSNKVEIASDK